MWGNLIVGQRYLHSYRCFLAGIPCDVSYFADLLSVNCKDEALPASLNGGLLWGIGQSDDRFAG